MSNKNRSKSKEPKHYRNVFHDLKDRKSILMTLFNPKNTEILNIGAQAPSPSKDYCQLILTQEKVVFRWWKITLRGDSDTKYPGEIKDTYEDFPYDENIQRDIVRVFGKSTFTYVQNIVEKGKIDYLPRLPEKVLMNIISYLPLEDISRLSQVNTLFRQLCRSDKVWYDLYRRYYTSEIKKDLLKLAERDGWRKLFFTNKIKLQLEIRRQARSDGLTPRDVDPDSVYFTPRRPVQTNDSMPRYKRSTKSATKKSNQYDQSVDSYSFLENGFNRFSFTHH